MDLPSFQRSRIQGPLALAAAWAVVLACSLLTRGPMPIDETRYLAVAWEMWQRGDFLVPRLGGIPYSDKPPLLFWLIHLGWGVFGVDAWWPRLLPQLFAAGNLLLTARLARRLWPDLPLAAQLAPMLLMSAVVWTLYSTMLMFDMLVTFFVLLALHGLARLALGARWRWWWMVGAALGLGALAKGPVVLVYTLLPALFVPWAMGARSEIRRTSWFVGIVAALFLAAAIALAWALPAARSGGDHYADAILWAQTAGRIARPEAPHAQPFWWYVAVLPLVWFPWILWRPAWVALAGVRPDDPGHRFILCVCAMSFLGLSLISGKQAHYLLPLCPLATLLLARCLAAKPARRGPRPWFIPAALVAVAAGLLILGSGRLPSGWPEWLAATPPWASIAIALAGIAILATQGMPAPRQGAVIATGMIAFVAILHLGVFRVAYPYFDMQRVAGIVSNAQHAGRPVAYVGDYEGDFNFVGRLERSPEAVGREAVEAWAADHPEGLVVLYHRSPLPEDGGPFVHTQRYRGKNLTVWDAPSFTLHHALADWIATVQRRED